MTVFEYLNLRYEWEEIVKSFRFPKGHAHQKIGTIDNMTYFLERGPINNRFREGYDRAVEIAKEVCNADVDKERLQS